MKNYFKALILMLICFSVLIPFASDFPDGLETVAENYGVKGNESIWNGIMPDYKLPIIENPYVSTLLAGLVGIFLVLGGVFLLGKAITKPHDKERRQKV